MFGNIFLIFINLIFLSVVKTFTHELDDIGNLDIYLQVERGGVSKNSCKNEEDYLQSLPNNAPDWLKYFHYNMFRNCIRDGRNEGFSKGYIGDYDYNDTSIMPVPYGCWYRATDKSGIYVNLGNKILIEDRRYLINNVWNLNKGYSDRLFCSKALNNSYASIITNNPYANYLTLGSELITCAGNCGTVKFNNTCPPNIEIYKGYLASRLCQCSDSILTLNCDQETNNREDITFNTIIDENKCILETTELSTHEINAIHNLSLTLIITYNLFHFNKISSDQHIKALWKEVNSLNRETIGSNNRNVLLLNLQHDFSTMSQNKLFVLSSIDDKIEWGKYYDIRAIINPFYIVGSNTTTNNNNSILGYTTSPLYQLSSRKIITINGVYLGIITSMKEFHYNKYKSNHQLLTWLIDDVRCLKKQGAYSIILIGIFDYKLSEYLIRYLHKYVDLIICVGGNIKSQKNIIYSHFDIDRILQFNYPENVVFHNDNYNNQNITLSILGRVTIDKNTSSSNRLNMVIQT